MTPDGIADAALLAAQAPAGGVLPLRDDGVESALLDLGADRPAVARSKLVAVARAFGPRLQLHEGFRLFIHSGELAPIEAATLFARTAFVDAAGPLMAVVRGEDVHDQLESLIAAGCRLEDHTGKWSLTDERRTIAKAWAAMPQSLVQSALEEGATVVISRQATKETLGGANLENDLVAVDLVERYELRAVTPHAGMLASLPMDLQETISQYPHGADDTVAILATATSVAELEKTASRLELAARTGAFERPLRGLINPRVVGAWIQVPVGLLELGIDLRTAVDWSN